MLTLGCMAALSTAPLSHRILEYTRHTTAIHKNAAVCIPIFETVESGCSLMTISIEEFLKLDDDDGKGAFVFIPTNPRSYSATVVDESRVELTNTFLTSKLQLLNYFNIIYFHSNFFQFQPS